MSKKAKTEKPKFKKSISTSLIVLLWLVGLLPFFSIIYLRYVKTDNESLPSVSMLENQEELLATTVFADDGVTELGKYWKVNRTSVSYNEISPYVISALISTEDERFETHSGIDIKAVGRAIINMGEAGGASTVNQQLTKLIFTLKERDERRQAQQSGAGPTEEQKRIEKMSGIERRLYEKVKENVIALRLEKRSEERRVGKERSSWWSAVRYRCKE